MIGWVDDPRKHATPSLIVLISYLDRFGAQAVYGRPLSAGELRRMAMAERLVEARRNWKAASDAKTLPAFAREHPEQVRLVTQALSAMNRMENART